MSRLEASDVISTCSHPHLVFMYGTLKSTEPNHHHLFAKGPQGAQFVGHARTVAKYPLLVTTPFNIPFLLHKEGTGHRIIGELYRLDDETMAYVDWFEDHPNWYQRRQVPVELFTDKMENSTTPLTVTCWMYGLHRFKDSLLELPLVEAYYDKNRELGKRYKPYNMGRDEPLCQYLFDD
ncbi:putative gamma-glutamylcyclotransferase CG2811 [Physella acuta]|uniref:putative gamma-glutamylcyclotransferase CG2811 n=1 Tax=Physella acuta TaxID=109671 RepID=UPI0027DAF155|nr:putative gamma-glutamylcyclotransferase CG2811 [Physella acuta]